MYLIFKTMMEASSGNKERRRVIDALMFLEEKRRMCDSYDLCKTCPLYSWDKSCSARVTNEPEEVIAIVEKWSEENPPKTYKDVFLELHPNAKVNTDGTPLICIKDIYGGDCTWKYESCKSCWNQPYKEV